MPDGIRWAGRAEFEDRMRKAPARLRQERRRNLKAAGDVLARAEVSQIHRAFPQGRGTLAGRVRVLEQHGLYRDSVSVGPAGKPSVYGRVLEFGMLVLRRRGRYRRSPHMAQYRKHPWLKPAVDVTASRVQALIGRSFRVV